LHTIDKIPAFFGRKSHVINYQVQDLVWNGKRKHRGKRKKFVTLEKSSLKAPCLKVLDCFLLIQIEFTEFPVNSAADLGLSSL